MEEWEALEDAFGHAAKDNKEFQEHVEAIEEHCLTDRAAKEQERELKWDSLTAGEEDSLQAALSKAGHPDQLEFRPDDFKSLFELKAEQLQTWPEEEDGEISQLVGVKKGIKKLIAETHNLWELTRSAGVHAWQGCVKQVHCHKNSCQREEINRQDTPL